MLPRPSTYLSCLVRTRANKGDHGWANIFTRSKCGQERFSSLVPDFFRFFLNRGRTAFARFGGHFGALFAR